MGWRVIGCGAVLAVAVGLLGGPVTAAPSAPPDAGAAPSAAADRVDLSGDYVVPRAGDGIRPRVRRWPGTRIRYYESIPAKWDWGLSRAIEHWNQSGGRMRFVEVASKRRAQLVISYGQTWGADGVATLGPTRHAFVHLSPTYRTADPDDAMTRVWVGRLFAHELGHVLGFDHTQGSCSLMYPFFDMGLCPLLAAEPGYYLRRWIDKALLRRYVAAYGGSARRPPKRGLIAPLPPQLDDVRFAGGQDDDEPVRITWRPPARVAEGTRVRVFLWKRDSCERRPDGFTQFRVKPGAGSWSDPDYAEGTWCYSVQVENRYGAARPATTRAMSRWTPVPDAPALSPVGWDEALGMHTVEWSAPEGTSLVVQRDPADPGSCPTAYDESLAEPLFPEEDGYWLSPDAPEECLVFFAVSDWGTVSPPTTRVVSVPALAVGPTVGELVPDPDFPWTVLVAASVPDERYRLGIEVLPGPCPAMPPADAGWWDGWEGSPGEWELSAEAEGVNCALFTAVDDRFWGFVRHGPVVAREFTAS